MAEPTAMMLSSESESFSVPESSSEPEWYTTFEPMSEPEIYSTGEPVSEPELFSSAEPLSEQGTWAAEPEFFSSAEPEHFSSAEPEYFSSAEPEMFSSAEPETFPSSEPEFFSSVEPETLHPEPSGEPSQPEPEMFPKPEPGQSFAEPVPNWAVAKPMYQAAWEIHVYLVAVLFALLAIAAAVNIIRLVRRKDLKSRGYFISLNGMMLLLGTVRAIFFFVDGYNSNNLFPQAVAYFFISIAFPCLTAAFYVLFTALLKSLRVKYMSPKIFSPAALIGIITFNFTLSLLTDFVVGYFFEMRFLILFCQIVYAVWGVLFTVSYLVLFVRLYRATQKRNRDVMRMDSMYAKSADLNASGSSYTSQSSLTSQSRSQSSVILRLSKMALSVKITLVVCLFFVCITILNIANMTSEMGIMTNQEPEPWSWWIYNFVYRLCEFGMAATIVYVGYLPFRNQGNESVTEQKVDEAKYKKYSDV